MIAKTKLTIDSLVAASVDIGRMGRPGDGASKICCVIKARRDGRWDAVGSASDGQNQGYYQENYSYGPWDGRGATPRDAVDAMVERSDDLWKTQMRNAGSDAILEMTETSFAELAKKEADRIEDALSRDKCDEVGKCRIAGNILVGSREFRDEIRTRAIKILRRNAPKSPLDTVSDDEILAEAKRRGLIAE